MKFEPINLSDSVVVDGKDLTCFSISNCCIALKRRMKLRQHGLVLATFTIALTGCRGPAHRDQLVALVTNPTHTYRASVVLREYEEEGHPANSPITYVLLDQDTNSVSPDLSKDFPDSQVVMKPAQCGPLSLQWTGENDLKVICEKCGMALSAAGPYATGMGKVRIDYEGFPNVSSWETAPTNR